MRTKLDGFAASALVVAVVATPAAARQKRIAPYIEASQVLSADVRGGDVLTYTQLSAGIDASLQTRRAQVQISYRYDHNFSYKKGVGDNDVHTGLARAAVKVAPGFSIDGGAVATRARADIRGDAPGQLVGNLSNTSQVYSADIGPSLATHAGPIGVAASYRFGATMVKAPSATGVAPGAPKLDRYDKSTRHVATASAGVKPGQVLPVGLSVSGAYEREDAGQLDQRYEGYYGRGDIVAPVTPTLALTAGAGYEDITITQRDPLIVGGVPATDARGRFLTDPASPRRIAFDTTGLFWDAGVLYRPSPRATFQARVGKRYDTMSYTGSAQFQAGSGIGVNIGVYDGVQSFGRQLRAGVASLPTSFVADNDGLGQNYNGCVFGASNAAAGGCLNPALQSVSTANYRARGVDGVIVAARGPTTFGFGAGYSNRKFLVPDLAPGLQVLNGANDESYYAQAFASQKLDANSGIDGNLYANHFDSGVAGAAGVYSAGASGSYYRRWGRLGATASLGLYGFDTEASEAQLSALARLGIRYGF